MTIFDKKFLSLASSQKFHLVLHPMFYDFEIPEISQSSLARERGLLTDMSQWTRVLSHMTDYNKLCRFQGSSSITQLLSSHMPKDLSRDYGMNPACSPSLSCSLSLCLSLTKSKNLLLELQTH